MFIKSRIYLDDEYVVMTRNYFLQYTQLEILEFFDTLIQHIESVKKSIDKRALHKREYDIWVNERQMQKTEEKVDMSKALDASLVNTKSSGTKSKKQDTNSRLGNDAHADDADIRPIYDEEPMVVVQTTAEINVFATRQQHTKEPEFNNKGEKCVFNANHVSCVTKFLKEVNSRAKVPSNKIMSRNKLVEQKSVAKKPERQIPKGHRWVPTGKIFTSSTTKVDSVPTNGSNKDISNQYEYEQTLNVSAGTLNLSAGTSFNLKKEGLRVCSELRIHDHNNELSSSKLVPKVVPSADTTTLSKQELDLLFIHFYDEFFNV
nr:hypothetical protein [Tanacetum cinerariifolium]